jgi:hypothetical protein
MEALTQQEMAGFASALWSDIDPSTKMPAKTDLVPHAFLFLPEPESGLAQQRFREWVLSHDPPQLLVERNGEVVFPSSMWRDYDSTLLKAIIRGTRLEWDKTSNLIDWSVEEVSVLLARLRSWWDHEALLLSKVSNVSEEDLSPYHDLVHVMQVAILPRLTAAAEPTKSQALGLLTEVKEKGICVLRSLPMTLRLEPGRSAEVEWELRLGLDSASSTSVVEAIWGLLDWLRHASLGSLPHPQTDLLAELIGLIVARRQTGLAESLNAVQELLKESPNLFSPHHLTSMCLALHHLEEETRLPEPNELQGTGLETGLSVSQRPAFRAICASIARRLADMSTPAACTAVVENWRAVAQSDPLPEVRRAWRDV